MTARFPLRFLLIAVVLAACVEDPDEEAIPTPVPTQVPTQASYRAACIPTEDGGISRCDGGGGNACGARVCGTVAGPNGPVSCGTCPAGKSCNIDGQCQDCPQKTCADYLGRCGKQSDGCGSELECACPNGVDPELSTCLISQQGFPVLATTTPNEAGICGCSDNKPDCPLDPIAPSPALQRFDLGGNAAYICTAAIAVAPWLPLQRGFRVRGEATMSRTSECPAGDPCQEITGGSITMGGAIEVCGLGGYFNFTAREKESKTKCVECRDGRNACGPVVKSSKEMGGTVEGGVTATFDVNPFVVVADRVAAGGLAKRVFARIGKFCDNPNFGKGYANVRGGVTFSTTNTIDTKGPGGPGCPAQGKNCNTEDALIGLHLGGRAEVDLSCKPWIIKRTKWMGVGEIALQVQGEVRFDVGGSIGREWRTGECGARACTKGTISASALLSLSVGLTGWGTGFTASLDGKCWFNKTWAEGCGSSTPVDVGCKLEVGAAPGGRPGNGD